ncbi:metallophosphoesterase [Geitlerinema sp. PCC 9228]|uniref:metallophosphoesterase n=1 Tax=Geitlerinema sp. PCC 9228 TaxID=111611 RepID=UPI0008F9A388|nr:metallophosphoesterase [Geitlerinema sp. PCC 9228]
MTVTIAQLTDTHLLPQRDRFLRGIAPWYSLQAVLQPAAATQPDLLLLTGDLADSGEAAAYQHLRDLLVPHHIPVAWVGGNHDDLQVATEVLSSPPIRAEKAISLGSWRLLLVNSILPTAEWGEGYIFAGELAWLQRELQTHPHQPTAVAVHHHPLPMGIDWLDRIALQNAHEFLTLLANHPQVRWVTCGHVHMSSDCSYQDFHCYTTPSTFMQVFDETKHTDPESQMPGFRLFSLYSDGGYATEIHRVELPAEAEFAPTTP